MKRYTDDPKHNQRSGRSRCENSTAQHDEGGDEQKYEWEQDDRLVRASEVRFPVSQNDISQHSKEKEGVLAEPIESEQRPKVPEEDIERGKDH